MKTRLLSTLALLIGLQPLPAKAQEAWKLPAILPMTGALAAYAAEIKLSFEIALDNINKAGGIQGRPVKLEVMDSQSNPGQVSSLIRQACSDGLVTLLSLSTEARVAFPVANSMQCPTVAVATAGMGLAANNRPWEFSMLTPSDVITGFAMETMIGKLKPKSAVVIIEKADPASADYGAQVVKKLEEHAVKAESLTVAGTDMDFGPAVTRASGASPDLIVLATLDRAAVGVLKELRKSGNATKVLLTQSAFNSLVGGLGPVLENVYRYAQTDTDSSRDKLVVDFVAAFKSRDNGRAPTTTGAMSYDAIMMVKDTLIASGVTGNPANLAADRKKFTDTLAALKNWTGVGGTVSMSPQGYLFKQPTVLLYHGGTWETVQN
jgi:branched-chain amino acid transport system substrate-binding protein